MTIFKVFLLCLVSCAASTDEGSMLQVEVSEHSAEAVQSALTTIGQQISSLATPDKAHRVAINTLMKTVAREKKLTPAAKDTLINVSALLSEMLPALRSDKDAKDLVLQQVIDAVANCNTASVSETSDKHDLATAARTDHFECRGEESTAETDKTTACNQLVSWMMSRKRDSTCQPPAADRSQFEAWASFLSTELATFTSAQEEFLGYDASCDSTTDTWTSKKDACDGLQTNFENKFCLWHSALNDMCNIRTTCYDDQIDIHNGHVTSITPLSAQRVNDAAIITHVICLIDNLVAGNTDLSACDGQGTDASLFTSDYANVFPDIPDKTTCDVSPAAVHPGSATWVASEYGDFPTNAPAAPGLDSC